MGERLSATELVEWQAYDRIEPIGDDRMEYMLGQIAMMCVAPWSKRKHQLKDFIPTWGEVSTDDDTNDTGLDISTRRVMAMFGHPDGKY